MGAANIGELGAETPIKQAPLPPANGLQTGHCHT